MGTINLDFGMLWEEPPDHVFKNVELTFTEKLLLLRQHPERWGVVKDCISESNAKTTSSNLRVGRAVNQATPFRSLLGEMFDAVFGMDEKMEGPNNWKVWARWVPIAKRNEREAERMRRIQEIHESSA